MKTAWDFLPKEIKNNFYPGIWAEVHKDSFIQAMEDYAVYKQRSSEPMLMPFDLEVALAHPERVRLRNGKSISEIYECKTIKDYNIVVAFDGGGYWVTKEGRHDRDEDNEYDLFLLAETKTMWVNVYDEEGGYGISPRAFDLEQEAIDNNRNAFATIPITIPVK